MRVCVCLTRFDLSSINKSINQVRPSGPEALTERSNRRKHLPFSRRGVSGDPSDPQERSPSFVIFPLPRQARTSLFAASASGATWIRAAVGASLEGKHRGDFALSVSPVRSVHQQGGLAGARARSQEVTPDCALARARVGLLGLFRGPSYRPSHSPGRLNAGPGSDST